MFQPQSQSGMFNWDTSLQYSLPQYLFSSLAVGEDEIIKGDCLLLEVLLCTLKSTASTGDSRRQVLSTSVSSFLPLLIELPKDTHTHPTITNWIKAIKAEKTNEESDRNQMDRLQSYGEERGRKILKSDPLFLLLFQSEPINPLDLPNEHWKEAQFIKRRENDSLR